MTTGMPTRSRFWLRITNSPSATIMRSTDAVSFFWRIGIQQISPGSRKMVKIQTPIMPPATMLPSWRKGGEIEKFSDRKPMAVVKTATVIPSP